VCSAPEEALGGQPRADRAEGQRIHDLRLEHVSRKHDAVRSQPQRSYRRKLPPRTRRPTRPDSHRRRQRVVHARRYTRGIHRRPAGRTDLCLQPHPGRARKRALLKARPRVLGSAARRCHDTILDQSRSPAHEPDLRIGRCHQPRQLPHLERRNGADRALCCTRADRQRLTPQCPGKARWQNHRRARCLRLSAFG